MTDPILNDLLAYHNPLDDQAFKNQVITKIKMAERKRRIIMFAFTLMGLLLSVLYMWSVLPEGILQNLLTPINGLLLSSIGLFIVWLWTEELADG